MANNPFLCLVWALSDPPPGIPGLGPSHPWVPPGNYPDQGLPGQSPGAPSHPIYHPGHPDHGRPSHPISGVGEPSHPWVPPGQGGQPSHPIYGQGGQPTHPIHIPGIPDQGLPPGQPIPPEEVTPPQLPDEYEDELVVAVKAPGQDWKYTSFDVAPDQGQPAPTPHQ